MKTVVDRSVQRALTYVILVNLSATLAYSETTQDSFAPAGSSHPSFQDPFDDVRYSHDVLPPYNGLTYTLQDTFGPFSDNAAASGSDPFTFASNSATEEFMEDSSFDSFGDFGDFQSAGSGSFEAEGTLTPTGADSWSFTSASSGGSFEDNFATDRRVAEAAAREQDERTARDN